MNIVPEKVNNINIAKVDDTNLETQEITISNFKTFSVQYDDITVPANSRINLQSKDIEGLLPGYKICGFFQISKLKGFNAPAGGENNWQKVFIESFSTTAGTTRPNVSFFNGGTTDALVNATFGVLCAKINKYTINGRLVS